MIAGVYRARRGRGPLRRAAHRRLAARTRSARRHRAHLPDRQAVRRADGARQRHRRRAATPAASVARGQATRRAEVIEQAGPRRQARPAGLLAHPARPQAAGGGARARHRPAPAAARRGDGRPAPDRDRPDGRGVPRAQRARGPHHPADRARDARGDGAVAATSSCCTTARSSRAARRRRSCAIRRCSSATSARRPKSDAPASPRTSISSTATRRRSTASRSRWPRARSSPSSAPTAPASRSLIRTIAGIEKPRAGRITFRGRDITRPAESHRICNLGIGQVAEGRQVFPIAHGRRRTCEMGAHAAARARRRSADARSEVYAMFPRLAERKRPAGRHHVGRRAADARDRPLPDGQAGAHHVRRALARPRAALVQEVLRTIRAAQPARADDPAGGAERRGLAEDLAAAPTCSRTAASS